MKKFGILLLVCISVISVPLFSSNFFVPFAETEQGTISILHHVYQNGVSSDVRGDLFDFRNQGGQELLYPFERYAIGATIAQRHRVWFTYQPFEVVTNSSFEQDVEMGGIPFAAGTPMELTYSFPFYRLSYTYDLLGAYEEATLGVGLVLQIRNASIRFKALDDSGLLYVSQNLGLVPALALYAQYRFPFNLVLTADIAGSYADSAFFNGADFEFSGSILDASLRAGYSICDEIEIFGNARFFGGTSEGTSQFDNSSWTVSNARFTKNNIVTVVASVGVLWSR